MVAAARTPGAHRVDGDGGVHSPFGANQQQWTFVTVRDLDLKARVAELVDAAGLNPAAPGGVQVQLLSRAPEVGLRVYG